MINSVPETTTLALSGGQGPRERSGAKAISDQTQVQDKQLQSPVSSSSENRNDASEADDIQKVVSEIQDSVNQIDPQVQFSVEQDLNRVVVKVVERDSGELIRQFPPEEVLRVQRFFEEQSGGIILEEQA